MNHVPGVQRPPKRGMAFHALTMVSCKASAASSTLPRTAMAARHRDCLFSSNNATNASLSPFRARCIRSSTQVPPSRSFESIEY